MNQILYKGEIFGGVGEDVTNKQYNKTIGSITTFTGGTNSEIFNNYKNAGLNIAEGDSSIVIGYNNIEAKIKQENDNWVRDSDNFILKNNFIGGGNNIVGSNSRDNFVYGDENIVIGITNVQVARGNIINGRYNKVIGAEFSLFIGQRNKNTASCIESLVFGNSNNINVINHSLLGGDSNQIGTIHQSIIVGAHNEIQTVQSSIINGDSNIVSNCTSSIINGLNNHLSGSYNLAIGRSNNINGTSIPCLGIENEITGSYIYCLGSSNTLTGSSIYNIGNNNAINSRPNTLSIGQYLNTNGGQGGDTELLLGKYNALTNKLLILGNGTTDNNRSNALEIDYDGSQVITLKDTSVTGLGIGKITINQQNIIFESLKVNSNQVKETVEFTFEELKQIKQISQLPNLDNNSYPTT